MNAHQITAFAHAVREGSFVKAAERLGVSQSAVSQHVAKLERAVGAPLLVRGRNALSLTPAGRDLFALAERFITLEQQIDEAVGDYRALDRGHLSIIANAPRPALQLISEYKRRYPKVDITFTLYDWTRAMRLIAERHVDVGIVTEPELPDGMVRRTLGHQRYKAYLRVDHHLARRAEISFADLADETVLLPEEGSYTGQVVGRQLRALGLSFGQTMRVTTFPLMKEAVLHGVGVALFLEDSLHPTPSIVTRPVADMPERHECCVVAPSDKLGLRTVASFMDMAVETAAPMADVA